MFDSEDVLEHIMKKEIEDIIQEFNNAPQDSRFLILMKEYDKTKGLGKRIKEYGLYDFIFKVMEEKIYVYIQENNSELLTLKYFRRGTPLD